MVLAVDVAGAPPVVTNRVPGVTGTKNPRGTRMRSRSSRLAPADNVTVPATGSRSAPTARPSSRTTVPPEFCAASP
jgi:hypothetical protein